MYHKIYNVLQVSITTLYYRISWSVSLILTMLKCPTCSKCFVSSHNDFVVNTYEYHTNAFEYNTIVQGFPY